MEEGKILPRTFEQINSNIDDFVFLRNFDNLVACAGLKDCKEGDMGEIYALAVSKEVQNQGFVQMQISELPKKRQALFNHQRNSSIFFKDVE